jgi:perosamine synthetase
MQPYKQLEKEYKKFVGAKYGVAVNSGTSALHLAFLAIDLKPKEEVILCDFAMASCAFAISYCGATPVFVDCDDTLNIDTTLIEKKITKNTVAILAIHTYGRLSNMKEILRIAKKHHLKVIEDACEAQGAVYKSKADITCYSFYENKIIHAEEGGMCTTDNKKYADRINYLKNMAFGEEHDYFHKEIGYNYRMPNAQAELALKSLKYYEGENVRRRYIEKQLDEIIIEEIDHKGSQIKRMPKRDAVWVYDYLGESGDTSFEVRPFFKPLSTFPMYGGKCQSPKALHYSKIGHYIKI